MRDVADSKAICCRRLLPSVVANLFQMCSYWERARGGLLLLPGVPIHRWSARPSLTFAGDIPHCPPVHRRTYWNWRLFGTCRM